MIRIVGLQHVRAGRRRVLCQRLMRDASVLEHELFRDANLLGMRVVVRMQIWLTERRSGFVRIR